MDKQRKIYEDIDEQNIYAQLWKLDLLKKEEREIREAEKKRQLVGDTMNVLDW